MKKSSTIIRFVLVGCLVAASWFGYIAFKKPKHSIYELDAESLKFVQGDLPLLPGPYLVQGNPTDLKFEKIDLGISEFIEMSEEGDILYKWFGYEPKEFTKKDVDGFNRTSYYLPNPIFRIRRADGTIQDFPNVDDVRMTRGGQVFEIQGVGSNFSISTNGKVILKSSDQTPKHGWKQIYWGRDTKITDDGIFPNPGYEPHKVFANGWELKDLDLTDKPNAFYNASSTKLGTVGIASANGARAQIGGKDQIAMIKSGQIRFVELPRELKAATVRPYKQGLLIYKGPYSPTKLFRFEDEKFSEVPIPSGAAAVNFATSNSAGEMVIFMDVVDPLKKGQIDFPYNHLAYYVTNKKSYNLDEVLKGQNFAENLGFETITYIGSGQLDERGDILAAGHAADYNHQFLLRRIR